MVFREKRSLNFLCGECSQGLVQVLNILKAMNDLMLDIKQLKQNFALPVTDDLKSEIQQLKLGPTVYSKSSGTDEFIDELNDRQKRKNSHGMIWLIRTIM